MKEITSKFLGFGLLVVGMVTTGCATRDYDTVHFKFDQAVLDASAKETAKKNAEALKQNPQAKMVIEGHADERGTNEYNIALGEKRANAVYNYVVGLGVSPKRLDKKSWGEERPADAGQSEASHKKNRRAEFVALQPDRNQN